MYTIKYLIVLFLKYSSVCGMLIAEQRPHLKRRALSFGLEVLIQMLKHDGRPARSAMSNLWSCSRKYSMMKQSCRTRPPLKEKEDYLSNISLCTHGRVIAWAVTSGCAHTGTSLNGLWHLIMQVLFVFYSL